MQKSTPGMTTDLHKSTSRYQTYQSPIKHIAQQETSPHTIVCTVIVQEAPLSRRAQHVRRA